MNPMVPGLQGAKMSSSDKAFKLDLLDSEATVKNKIAKAHCKDGEVEGNGVLAFCKMVLFPLAKGKELIFNREEKYGGDVTFLAYQELETAFTAKKLASPDLKTGVAKYINQLLQPIRKTFAEKAMIELIAKAYPEAK